MHKIFIIPIIILLLFVYFPVFCYVEKISIIGNNLVTSEEIIETSEIKGKVLAFHNKAKTINKIIQIELIKNVKFQQISLKEIQILVNEKEILMATNINGNTGFIDEDLKFIRNISEYLIKSYPILTIQSESQIDEGIFLLKLLTDTNILISNTISEILVDKIVGTTIFTNDGIEIYFGKGQFEKKINNLRIILKDGKDKNMKESFIDLSNINKGVVNYNL